VERSDQARVITFFSDRPVAGGEVPLSEEAAHHAQVRRLESGDLVALTDGSGTQGVGRVHHVSKKRVSVVIDRVETIEPPPAVHLFLPVADRDRMLWLAEKATELQIATWNPVLFRRSKSVSPRGEGAAFDRKVRARMISALEQSGGAWLPAIQPVREVSGLQGIGIGVVLARGDLPLAASKFTEPLSLIIGPEGGIEPDELTLFRDRGWVIASLGDITLRFETAAIAAIAIARSRMTSEHEG
jgi:16S rRNA (uracil1498-N3)-methyltransferase